MKINYYLSALLLSLGLLMACSKDKEAEQPPSVKMMVEGTALNGRVNERIAFSAVNVNDKAYKEEWKLDDEVKSTSATFDFTPSKAGIYRIDYKATNSAGSFSHQYTINVGMPTVPVTPGSNAYVAKMFEYLPGPGQFTNKTIGTVAAAKSLEGSLGAVSLGAWGGYIVLGFDHTVINESAKDDIIIYGNATAQFAEPAIVWVMQDENANGLPDDTWYEVKGSEFGKSGYVRDYEVTYTRPATGGDVAWRDNKGNTGAVTISGASAVAYPSWLTANEYTLKGTLLPSSNLDRTIPTYITSAPFAYGYADNTPEGDKIDIANAIDKNGDAKTLGGIDFIKIQTAVQVNLGWLGEFSTEVLGVADLSLVK